MKRSELPQGIIQKMPKYNPDEPCAQCGFDRVKDEFRPPGTVYYSIVGEDAKFPIETTYPVIRRTCLRCGATWEVLPLSIEEDTSEPKTPFLQYHCSQCGSPGFPSVDGDFCTVCANKRKWAF